MRREQTLFRDYPIVLWLFGTFAIVIGALMHETIFVRTTFVVLGVAAVGFCSVLTVVSDSLQRTLTLRYRSLFSYSIRSFAWDEIAGVIVKEDSGEGNFRVELYLRSGERVPLRTWYSPGKWRHKRKARKLESALGCSAISGL